jgi:hypothetical protein
MRRNTFGESAGTRKSFAGIWIGGRTALTISNTYWLSRCSGEVEHDCRGFLKWPVDGSKLHVISLSAVNPSE